MPQKKLSESQLADAIAANGHIIQMCGWSHTSGGPNYWADVSNSLAKMIIHETTDGKPLSPALPVPTPATKLWRVRCVSCDRNYIGKTQEEEFFISEREACLFMAKKLEESNEKEVARGRNLALYRPDSVKGVEGWCNWQYGLMYVQDSITAKGVE